MRVNGGNARCAGWPPSAASGRSGWYAPVAAPISQSTASVLAAFDAQVQIVSTSARISTTCRDADDQQFLDLAAAHRAVLLSKDKAVLALRKRLLAYGAQVATALVPESR